MREKGGEEGGGEKFISVTGAPGGPSLAWPLLLLSKVRRAPFVKAVISESGCSSMLCHHLESACWEDLRPGSPVGTGLHAFGLWRAGQGASSSADPFNLTALLFYLPDKAVLPLRKRHSAIHFC